MLTRYIKILTLSSAVALMMPLAALSAQTPDSCDDGPERGHHEKMEKRHDKMFEELGLSAEQKKLLEENKTKHRESMKKIFEAMREKRKLFHAEMQKDELDIANLTRINNEMKALDAQMSDERLSGILEVRKILTKEQFKKFSEKMGQMGKGYKGKGKGRSDGNKGKEARGPEED